MLGFEPTLNDFPFLEFHRQFGRLPLETQSQYQDDYHIILKNKLKENFRDDASNVETQTQAYSFEIKFLSDSLSELRSARIKEAHQYPERASLLENIYIDVERVLQKT